MGNGEPETEERRQIRRIRVISDEEEGDGEALTRLRSLPEALARRTLPGGKGGRDQSPGREHGARRRADITRVRSRGCAGGQAGGGAQRNEEDPPLPLPQVGGVQRVKTLPLPPPASGRGFCVPPCLLPAMERTGIEPATPSLQS